MGIKISELPAIILPFDGGEKLPIVQSGVTRASNLSSFVNFLSGSLLADSELKSLSGVWQSNYTTTNSNSANWNNAYSSVASTSANWNNAYSSVASTSANWNNAYTTTNSNSANWNNAYSSVASTSANWNNAYTTTNSNSANWSNAYTAVSPNSANWNSVYSTVYATSGSWTGGGGGISLNTVTNYLSTNNVLLSSATILNTLSATSYVNNPTGKTIYVDSGVGTDTRTGLSKYDSFKPYRTLSAAETDSVIGDLVYVRAGQYAINSPINLNNEGNIFFETGATVNVLSGIVAFSFTQQLPIPINAISIRGNADFILGTGATGVLSVGGGFTTVVQFECNSISGPNTTSGTLFSCSAGTLSVDAKLIQMTTDFTASNATVFNITGSGRVTTRVPFVYCGVFLNGAGSVNDLNGNTTAQINTDIWTLITYSLSAGMTLNRVTTNFRIVNYNHTGVGVAYNWLEDTTRESHGFQGITWNGTNQPNITFTSTALTATIKLVRLYQNNILRTSAANSLSSTVPINVATYNAFAGVPATSNITLQIGSFTVDPTVNNY